MLTEYLQLRADLAAHGPGAAASGAVLCARLTATLDAAVAQMLPSRGRTALVAVGGYGRGELCLHSDVDLMLLHAGSLPVGAERAFYPLWDANLKVGHAVRGVREAVQAAREDLQTLTALLDARLVAGDADLFGDLRHALGELLRRNRLDLPTKLAALEASRRAAEPYRLQEPNVKDGRGGLRAWQGLWWERRARAYLSPRFPVAGAPSLAGEGVANRNVMHGQSSASTERTSDSPLLLQGTPSPRGGGGREERLDTLLATRNALHAVSGKPFDVYVHDVQQAVAEWLGVDGFAWSRRLYGAIHEIDRAVAAHWQTAPPAPPEPSRRAFVPAFLTRRSTDAPAPIVEAPPAPPAPLDASVLVMAARSLARAGGPPFDAAQSAAIGAALGPSWGAGDREALLALLRGGRGGQQVWDALDALGWAERAVPEWGHLRDLPHYAPFHLHPVDEHLWRTVEETLIIARRDSPEPALAGVAADLDSLDDALLAGWLHDIGKGWPGDHAVVGARAAREICRRTGFGPRTSATVTHAIELHLLLPTVATRRDLDDPAVIGDVADAVGDRRTLRVLYLLSVADSRATGPAVWNGWKASLLRSLYDRTDDELRRRDRNEPFARPPFDLAPLLESVRAVVSEAVVRQHLAAMPPGYTDAWSLAEIAQHLRLMWPPPASTEVRLEVTRGGPADDVTIALEDRPGLLSLTSGVLALHDISVLGGRFTTRDDGVAVQALHVDDALGQGIDAARWQRVRRDIPRVLCGELDLESMLDEKSRTFWKYRPARRRLVPPRVVVDPHASERATLVEVHAQDRIGLLHAITRALFELNLDIHVAKVDTLGAEVVDVFYVRDLSGHPPRSPQQCAEIERVVRAAV